MTLSFYVKLPPAPTWIPNIWAKIFPPAFEIFFIRTTFCHQMLFHSMAENNCYNPGNKWNIFLSSFLLFQKRLGNSMKWLFLQSFLSVFLPTLAAFLSKIVSYNIEHDLEETRNVYSSPIILYAQTTYSTTTGIARVQWKHRVLAKL